MAALAHELRYELLQREGNRRASLTQWTPEANAGSGSGNEAAIIHPDQIQINMQVRPEAWKTESGCYL